MTIPWGDVSTAFHTTGIPNIEVYMPGSMGMIRGAKAANLVRPLLGLQAVQKFLKARIGKNVSGPDNSKRAGQSTHVWGEARNAAGVVKTARVRTENVYSLTITGALAVVEHLAQHSPEGGAYTPAKLVGFELVSRLPGSTAITVS